MFLVIFINILLYINYNLGLILGLYVKKKHCMCRSWYDPWFQPPTVGLVT